jgi:oligopeptide transport system substrate-binding protein
VGIPYDPARAREYLKAAGYTDPADFPPFTLIASLRGSAAPGFYTQVTDALSAMWHENLGVSVTIEVHGDFGTFLNRLNNDTPQLWVFGWGADFNDPDNFLNHLFNSSANANVGHFASDAFDQLVNNAANGGDPAERQIMYIQAEQILTQDLVGVIPLFHSYFYRGGG